MQHVSAPSQRTVPWRLLLPLAGCMLGRSAMGLLVIVLVTVGIYQAFTGYGTAGVPALLFAFAAWCLRKSFVATEIGLYRRAFPATASERNDIL